MANKKKLLLPEYTSEVKYMAWSVTCIGSNWMIQGNLSLQYRKVSERQSNRRDKERNIPTKRYLKE
jgi:hypothetical protein